MSEAPEKDQKTEAPTQKRRREASEKGDVLQSKELGTALVIVAGAAWLALAGPLFVGSLSNMLVEGLTFDHQSVRNFDPGTVALRLIGMILLPVFALFAMTILAAIGGPALLGSFGFRSKAMRFNPGKMNPLSGLKRIFGMQGLVELGKSIAKVLLLGGIGVWLLLDQTRALFGLGSQDVKAALVGVGNTFNIAVLVMAFALALIAMINLTDLPWANCSIL